MPLMTFFLVTITGNSHQCYVKRCLRDMQTATKNGRAQKSYAGHIHHPPYPVGPRVKATRHNYHLSPIYKKGFF